MFRPQTDTSPGVWWGLGMGIEEQPQGPALWQWGHNNGYRDFAWLSRDRDLAFVFLCNGDGGMLALRDLLGLATGVAEHPAVKHLDYDAWDDPAEGGD
jgi:CubicO group peptidase (beta-lactamase class C family)